MSLSHLIRLVMQHYSLLEIALTINVSMQLLRVIDACATSIAAMSKAALLLVVQGIFGRDEN